MWTYPFSPLLRAEKNISFRIRLTWLQKPAPPLLVSWVILIKLLNIFEPPFGGTADNANPSGLFPRNK